MQKLTRLPIQDRFMGRAHRQAAEDIAYMRNLVDDVIRQRRVSPTSGMDLLNLMLEARDPETDRRLDDANIRNQVITFLIAGHETTSGLLTFALYELLRNPGVLAQAYAEVDTVLPGDAPPVYADLARMPVLDRVLKETLRLWPTAPAFAVAPFDDVVLGGRYRLRKDRRISVVLTALHRDPKVWANPERFDIDRFLPENEAKLPAHAYMPFGQGERACIGRQFALTEAKLALALMLRNFAFQDPHDYQFRLKETLTIKPDQFVLRARRRRPHERLVTRQASQAVADAAQTDVRGHGQAMTVLCASSLGTARELAEQIHAGAIAAGFDAKLADLDDAVGACPLRAWSSSWPPPTTAARPIRVASSKQCSTRTMPVATARMEWDWRCSVAAIRSGRRTRRSHVACSISLSPRVRCRCCRVAKPMAMATSIRRPSAGSHNSGRRCRPTARTPAASAWTCSCAAWRQSALKRCRPARRRSRCCQTTNW
jgi:cytochrome P450/NADPH-cytochrome P450 reductase